MRRISRRELCDTSAAVLDAVQAGETVRITRAGVEIAEFRPIRRRRRLSAEELVARHRALPRMECAALRAKDPEVVNDTAVQQLTETAE
ncbi:type II toxin-antitoxin system Phd/YefM family antitoxin [Nocardia neocaledoniensis]|uniref:type II toxin-antitoxin system Phd/YefM family antitoxin n=1 Tax=Nocardia neocaledoniensis TaxID=236511 RepID=UPI002455BF73|nr:prevent-host-death protein [Nocardia neocaledoniensis]